MSIVSNDDGINISESGSSASSSMIRRNGVASGRKLVVNGGKILIDAKADGLDSNGAIEVHG